ncbi:MAG: sensor histidine kinase [Syntrophobacteraceae bacterium]
MREDNSHLRIVLIEDDDEDFLIIRDLLSEMTPMKFELEWITDYDTGLAAISNTPFDVCLLDYRLGDRDGLEFLREATEKGCTIPIIFLTGAGNYEIDLQAMKMGAADYLPKNEISASILERSIRYAIAIWKSKNELRALSSKLLATQEEERKRIASELHDSIGQTFAAMKFWIEMALRFRDEGEHNAALNHLEQFVPILQRSIEETRSICMGLRPLMLDSMGLLATLDWLRRECMKPYPQRHIELETGVAEEEIRENLKVNIFRIAQEALNNIAKHSKAEWVDISLSKDGNGIELVISDDGVGMNLDHILQTSTTRSLGLTSMRERAELTGGRFSIESAPGEGTTIRACWPIEAQY